MDIFLVYSGHTQQIRQLYTSTFNLILTLIPKHIKNLDLKITRRKMKEHNALKIVERAQDRRW